MNYENILVTTDEAIATITFNRPKALNALNTTLLSELSQAVDDIRINPEIRVLILTGAGDKAFVAGADIKELDGLTPLQAKLVAKKGQETINKIAALPIPVIAAVNGYALGGGTEMALACDFIYASESASMGLPETNLGLIPGFGGTQRLSRLIGPNMAKELIYTGKMISAAEAYEIGLVNKVCAPDKLIDDCLEVVNAAAKNAPIAVNQAKRAINSGASLSMRDGLELEKQCWAPGLRCSAPVLKKRLQLKPS